MSADRAPGLRWVMALAAIALLGSCSSDPRAGYSSASLFDEEIRTIGVRVFDNTTFEHGLEVLLTDAIVKEIHRTTPWRVVTDDLAQTTLSGTITNVRLRRISRSRPSGLVQELAYEVAADYDWKDNRTGRVMVARRNFRSSDAFAPTLNVNERIDIGAQGAVEEMARDIVASLRSNW